VILCAKEFENDEGIPLIARYKVRKCAEVHALWKKRKGKSSSTSTMDPSEQEGNRLMAVSKSQARRVRCCAHGVECGYRESVHVCSALGKLGTP
jgi:hypothetical protein